MLGLWPLRAVGPGLTAAWDALPSSLQQRLPTCQTARTPRREHFPSRFQAAAPSSSTEQRLALQHALQGAPKLKVAIVGSGLAGLSTAVELLDQGYEVDIYESRPFVGGKVASYRVRSGAGGAQVGRGGWVWESTLGLPVGEIR